MDGMYSQEARIHLKGLSYYNIPEAGHNVVTVIQIALYIKKGRDAEIETNDIFPVDWMASESDNYRGSCI